MDQDLPKAIQAELDAAAEIEAQIAAEQAAPNGNTPETEAQETATDATESADKVAETTTQQTEAPQDDAWKQKFDVLTGKYNAEVPRLYQQLKEQASTLEKLQAELEANKAKPVEPEKPKESLVTSKDEDTFGSDLIDLARRVTRDEVGAVLSRIGNIEQMLENISQLPKQVEQVAQQQAQSTEDRYWSAIGKAIPDWEQIDSDPRWIEWLNLAPKFSIKTYRDLASEAISSGQVQPIVELVATWKEQAGIAQAQATQSNNKQELQRQVAPTKNNASSVPQGKKVWTGADYEKAFDPRLSAEMSEADIEALQAEAELAYQEGRIQW